MTVAGKVRQGLVHCSSSVLPGYRLGKTETYPGITAAYEKSFATWKALPCEVFLASHGAFFGLQAKSRALAAGKADAFVDPAGCKAFYAKAGSGFPGGAEAAEPVGVSLQIRSSWPGLSGPPMISASTACPQRQRSAADAPPLTVALNQRRRAERASRTR